MAAPLDTPSTGEIWHLTIDDLLAPLPESVRLGGSGPFVINLSASSAPIDVPTRRIPGCQHAHVYQVQRTEDGRQRYRLRIGPFANEDDADAVLKTVRDDYPSALTATADADDLRAIANRQAKSPVQTPAVRAPAPPCAPPPLRGVPAPPSAPPQSIPSPVPLSASPQPVRAPAPALASSLPLGAPAATPAQRNRTPTPIPTVSEPAALPSEPRLTARAPAPPALDSVPVLSAEQKVRVRAPAPAAVRAAPSASTPAPTAARAPVPEVVPKRAIAAPPAPMRAAAQSVVPTPSPAPAFVPRAPAPRAADPSSKRVPDVESTQTIRALTQLELEDDQVSRWFVIQLSEAEEAFDPETVPNLDIFSVYRLYSVAGIIEGRIVHALRLGFFSEQSAAGAVASYLAAFFEKPSIKRVSTAERERFTANPLEPRKDVGAKGKQAVIEITNERYIREKRTSQTGIK